MGPGPNSATSIRGVLDKSFPAQGPSFHTGEGSIGSVSLEAPLCQCSLDPWPGWGNTLSLVAVAWTCILSPGGGQVWGAEWRFCLAPGCNHLLIRRLSWHPDWYLRGAGAESLDKGPQAAIGPRSASRRQDLAITSWGLFLNSVFLGTHRFSNLSFHLLCVHNDFMG